MAEADNSNLEDNSSEETPELVLEDVVSVDPAELDDNQTKFLQENADNLTDEQKETFKDVLTTKEKEDDEPIDLDSIEPETRGKKAEKEEAKGKKEEATDDDEEEDDIDPDDKKTISKVVKKELSGVAEQLAELKSIKDQNEVEAFIRLNPNFSKYRDVALKYMSHPAYANIPTKHIMTIVASKDLQKMGAQKEREAATKAKETKGSGGTVRPQSSGAKIDWSTATKEEFEAERQRILQGGNRQ